MTPKSTILNENLSLWGELSLKQFLMIFNFGENQQS